MPKSKISKFSEKDDRQRRTSGRDQVWIYNLGICSNRPYCNQSEVMDGPDEIWMDGRCGNLRSRPKPRSVALRHFKMAWQKEISYRIHTFTFDIQCVIWPLRFLLAAHPPVLSTQNMHGNMVLRFFEPMLTTVLGWLRYEKGNPSQNQSG